MTLIWLLAAIPALASDKKLQAAVSVEPLRGIVEKVGGNRVAVRTLAGRGVDPHSFEPKIKELMELAKMDCFFTIGMPFELKLASKLEKTAPNLRQVYLAAGAQLLDGADHHHHHEGHEADGEGGEHDHADHGGPDPHLWLSPPMIKVMARNIEKALAEMDPDGAALFRKNLLELEKQMDKKHAELKKILAPVKGKSFYVGHPAFGYFADAYGLVQKPIEVGGNNPKPRELQDLMKKAKKANAKVIFTQPQFNSKAAKSVAKVINGKVVPLDPLDGDVMSNLDRIAKTIRDALK